MSLQPLTSLNPSITQDSTPYCRFQHHNSKPHNNFRRPPHHTAREPLSPSSDGAGHTARASSCRVLRSYAYVTVCTSVIASCARPELVDHHRHSWLLGSFYRSSCGLTPNCPAFPRDWIRALNVRFFLTLYSTCIFVYLIVLLLR